MYQCVCVRACLSQQGSHRRPPRLALTQTQPGTSSPTFVEDFSISATAAKDDISEEQQASNVFAPPPPPHPTSYDGFSSRMKPLNHPPFTPHRLGKTLPLLDRELGLLPQPLLFDREPNMTRTWTQVREHRNRFTKAASWPPLSRTAYARKSSFKQY